MPAPKFDTLGQLRDAYATGLIPNTVPLVIDNDGTYVYIYTEDDPDYDDSEKVFEMHPGDLLMQALDLLGIPYEGV
jgi:hypothetical protein